MQNATLWRGVLGVEKAVVEGVEFDDGRAGPGRAREAEAARDQALRAVQAAVPWL